MLRAAVVSLILLCAGAAHAEPGPASRYIPLQLIVGGTWDGTAAITYPSGSFAEGFPHGSTWVGPQQWVHPKTGKTLTVYDRSRGNRSLVKQIFVVRDDQTAIGRVADSRFGITACDGEGKYPLGLWHEGETRRFDYTCWYGDKPRPQVTTIVIRRLDFTCGEGEHCLEIEWILRAAGDAREIDHRIYRFAPRRGMVDEREIR